MEKMWQFQPKTFRDFETPRRISSQLLTRAVVEAAEFCAPDHTCGVAGSESVFQLLVVLFKLRASPKHLPTEAFLQVSPDQVNPAGFRTSTSARSQLGSSMIHCFRDFPRAH
jgi:hypothetical protein